MELLTNKGKQVVSEDSTEVITLDAPVATPVTAPSNGPTNLVAVITPT